jgi:hypothetical protein
VPLQMVRQHAQQNVGSHAFRKAMMNRSDFEIDGF